MQQVMPALNKSDEANLLLLALECSTQADGWSQFLTFVEITLGCRSFLSEFDLNGRATSLFVGHRPGHELSDLLAQIETEGGRNVFEFLLSEASLHYPYCKVSLDKLNRKPQSANKIDGQIAVREAKLKENDGSDDLMRNAPGLVSPINRTEGTTILFACVFTSETTETIDTTRASENFRMIIEALTPALNLFLNFKKERADNRFSGTLLSALDSPAILVNHDREILTHTAAGLDALFKLNVVLEQGDKLVFRNKQIESGFRFLTEKYFSEEAASEAVSSSSALQDRSLVHSVLLKRQTGSLTRITIEAVPQSSKEPIETPPPWFLIRVFEPKDPPKDVELVLQDQFDLSHSEARLARRLTISGSMNATVNHLGITRNTAKTHLRRIFEKTGINTQLQLAGLVHKLSGLF
jgi:DNA-binding CsgD family transcriptional regulator